MGHRGWIIASVVIASGAVARADEPRGQPGNGPDGPGRAFADEPRLWTEKTFAQPLDPDGPVSMRAFARLAKELSPAVVNISVLRADQQGLLPFFGKAPGGGLGTGFIIHTDGFVLTNNHVIEGAEQIQVKLWNDHEYAAKVVGAYPPLDVALIRFEPKEPLTVAALGNSERVEIGEWVVAIGNPFGLNHTVTAGIVSAKGRHDVVPSEEPNHARFIQTDASINPGNSGGPLINIRGEVVGINTAINAAGQGIGFAVPIDMVKTLVPQLAKGKVNRSFLGVRVGPVPADLAAKIAGTAASGDLRRGGALVREVMAGTPAEKAGVQAGDVVLDWDGQPLADWQDLPWRASTAGTARPVSLHVNRGGKVVALKVALTDYPEERAAAIEKTRGGGEGGDAKQLGLTVGAVPVERRAGLGLHAGVGVLVRAVAAGSIAESLGIAAGDVITQVNYGAVKDGPTGFDKAVKAVPAGEVLALTIRRGDRFLFKAFTR